MNSELNSQVPNIHSKSQVVNLNLKNKVVSHTTDEDELTVPTGLPLKQHISVGEMDGLLKFPSTSSACPDLSRHGSEALRIEENPKEKYGDLLGFDDFMLATKLKNAPTQPQSVEGEQDRWQTPLQDKLVPKEATKSPRTKKMSKSGPYTEFVCAPEVETSSDNHYVIPNAKSGMNSDLEANHSQEIADRVDYDPISEVVDQNVVLNIQNNPDAVVLSPSFSENNNLVSSPPPVPVSQMTPEQIRIYSIGIPETKVYIHKIMCFFAAMIVTSACMFVPWKGIAFFEMIIIGPFVFSFAYCYLDIHYTAQIIDYLWFDYGDYFGVFDALNAILFILAVQFRLAGILGTCVYASLTFFLAAHTYLYHSKGQVKKNLGGIITRYYYGFQVIFFVLRLDGYSDWEWVNVFFLTWIYLGAKILFYIANTLIILYKVITRSYPKRITKIIGFFWYTGYKGLIFIPLLATYGFVEYQKHRDYEFFRILSFVSIGVNAILLAIGFLAKKYLIAFVLRLHIFESRLSAYEMEQERLKVKKEITLELEKKENYFVMLSSTYFLPLHKSFYAKGKESLTKIKEMFSTFRFGNKGKTHQTGEIKTESLADVQKLKLDKLNLDRKFSKMDEFSRIPSARGKDRKQTERLRSKMTGNISDFEGNSIVHDDNKLAMSVDDLDKVKKMEIFPNKPKGNEEEDSCYLCYVNPRNVILMNCGHGGICYDCASTMLKQKNECMECRKEVDAIYTIDPNPKLFDIVKSFEFHKVVVTILNNENNK